MSISDFVTYRSYLALSAGARTVMWMCWIPIVVEATGVQAAREASAPGPVQPLQSVGYTGPV